MPLSFRFLSICPQISKTQGRLRVRTAWQLRLLTLGGFVREVVVDLQTREVYVYHRQFWFFARRTRILFSAVEAITYGYEDWSTHSILSLPHSSWDCFSVGLRLWRGDEVPVCTYYGEGAFNNDSRLPDWFYWANHVFDVKGTQDRQSRALVELLSQMIGVEIVPPRVS